ncbi:hypothetical protein [Methyloradius palustris]|uniref:Replication protein n=1 Tax=Methyloradius palustris TaxID=2778876 RepID=A0A8D5FX87_9PROT|nr:hypothetical protein [Methyloradius palustris]BCM23824.1 hypothetical protein ZMTM_00830 [Methyloradius palustris]
MMIEPTSATSKLAPHASLGISAKSSNAKSLKSQTEIDADKSKNKKIRYELQRHSQSLFYDRNAIKQHRVCSCHRNLTGDSIAIFRKVDQSEARIAGLVSCGSAWVCPICNAKITEARREQMQQAITAHSKAGGSCLLMTNTFPHEIDLPLDEGLSKFAMALDHWKNSRTYKRIFGTSLASIQYAETRGKPLKKVTKGEFPIVGSVRSLEVTHGSNGWHPHTHQVLFMQDESLLNSRRAIDELVESWCVSLIHAGLGDNSKLNDMLTHALDIRGGDYTADYVNKFGREPELYNGWTIAHETTKANSKAGFRNLNGDFHATPFQLLKMSLEGDEKAGALFLEFGRCFEGKRMNYWTNGLKDFFSLNDLDDEDLAAESAEVEVEEEVVLYLNAEEWRLVLKTNARGELIEAARIGGKDAVMELLDILPYIKHSHSGAYSVNRPKGQWVN